jgi:L-rhamnose mutarotase
MEKYAWKGSVKEGCMEEYIRRHDEIWPEMTATLNEAGVHNYTIWNTGDHLFGYYECESVEYAHKVQAESHVVARWNKSMEGIMVMEKDENGFSLLQRVFEHK